MSEPKSEWLRMSDSLRRLAEEKGLPERLLRRAIELRLPSNLLQRWLLWNYGVEFFERRLAWHERLTVGSLRGREATMADNDAFADLCQNAPEELGEWEIVSERRPNAAPRGL